MTHLGQAGLLLLLDLLVLVKRTPQSAKDHDHDDGHQQLVDGEAVLSGALAHRDWLGYLMEAGLRRRCHMLRHSPRPFAMALLDQAALSLNSSACRSSQ
jgi:integrase